mgnify:CR=1 FL=1
MSTYSDSAASQILSFNAKLDRPMVVGGLFGDSMDKGLMTVVRHARSKWIMAPEDKGTHADERMRRVLATLASADTSSWVAPAFTQRKWLVKSVQVDTEQVFTPDTLKALYGPDAVLWSTDELWGRLWHHWRQDENQHWDLAARLAWCVVAVGNWLMATDDEGEVSTVEVKAVPDEDFDDLMATAHLHGMCSTVRLGV